MFLAGLSKELNEIRGQVLGKTSPPIIRKAFLDILKEQAWQSVMLKNKYIHITTNSEVESFALIVRGF